MKKLNRKGYLTIEIILASVVAFAIAFFLIELTVKLVNKTNDVYMDTILMTEKAIITKNFRENIRKNTLNERNIGTIEFIYLHKNKCFLQYEKNNIIGVIEVVKEEEDNIIRYKEMELSESYGLYYNPDDGDMVLYNYDTEEIMSIKEVEESDKFDVKYEKKLSDEFIVGDITLFSDREFNEIGEDGYYNDKNCYESSNIKMCGFYDGGNAYIKIPLGTNYSDDKYDINLFFGFEGVPR